MVKTFKRFLIGAALILAVLSSAIAFAQSQPATPQTGKSAEGIWQGTIEAGASLRIVVKVARTAEGTLSGKMDSLDQGAKDIAIDEVAFTGDVFRFEIKRIQGVYEGKMNAEGTEIVGQWRQAGFSLPLTLKRTDKPPVLVLRRPQEPQKPYPYHEEEVTYENKRGGVKLAGTLTRPHSKGPFPAVLLITGSGAQDRNETVYEHRPFLVLADYLTRRGIAVLRVDDRGVGGSTGKVSESTSEDLAEDVLAGIEFLKSRKEIHRKRIGLIGHSEGGLIAPMVAARSKDVSFIVLMAGTGLTGEELLYRQGELIRKASGATDEVNARERRTQERIFAVIKQEENPGEAEKQLREIVAESLQKLPEQQKRALGDLNKVIDAQVKQVLSPWFRFFLTYDPKPTLRKVRCPVLAINGEKDLQVPPKENLAAIEAALKAGGNKEYRTQEMPSLNHLFQTAQTGSPAEYSKIEETIAPSALALIGDWIGKQTKR